jgi:hypothetical protein
MKGRTMVWIFLACVASLFVCVYPAISQEPTAEIRIKLINGMNGKPMKDTEVGLEGSPDYHELSVRTSETGIATVRLQKDSVIYAHNTEKYVACVDEAHGLVHNDFKVGQILSTGIVQSVAKPNRCRMTTSVLMPGELVLFVRPWKFLEDIPF